MAALITRPNLTDVDDIFAALVDLTAGLTEAEALRCQRKLILLLANHVGDREAIAEAIALSRTGSTSVP